MTARRILVAGWLVFAVYAYPGYLPIASVDQLLDARVDAFTDWHPTMMTELWRWVGWWLSGPAAMLAIQSGLLLFGTFAILRRGLRERTAAIAAACVLVAPPVMVGMAVVCAESQLVGFFVAGFAGVTASSRRAQVAGLVLLVQAVGMHPAAIVAAAPAIIGGLAWWPAGWKRYGSAAAAWLAVVVAACVVGALLVDLETGRTRVVRDATDIVGTYRDSPDIDDAAVRDELAGVPLAVDHDLQQRARSAGVVPARAYVGADRLFDVPADLDALDDARWRVVQAHPFGYLQFRFGELLGDLGYRRDLRWVPLYTEFLSAPSQHASTRHAARHSGTQKVLIACVRHFVFLCRPYLYALLAVGLLPLAIRRRHRDGALLFGAALGHAVGLMFTSLGVDYRAALLVEVATVIGLVPLLAVAVASLLARARRSRNSA